MSDSLSTAEASSASSMSDTLSVDSKTDLDSVFSKLGGTPCSQRKTSKNSRPEIHKPLSRSRKVSAAAMASAFVGSASGEEASVQTTLAEALCCGLSSGKWTEASFETSKEVLTAILLNIVRKRDVGVGPMDFHGKSIVIMDQGSEQKAMRTFNVSIMHQTRESFLKERQKCKGNSEFVLGKGESLLFLKQVEGNILHCVSPAEDACPTFTVGNVDGGFFRVQLYLVGGRGGGTEVSNTH